MPGLDLVLAALAAVDAIVIAEGLVGRTAVETFLNTTRQPLYTTAAQVSASLLGFILTAIPIFIAFGQFPRLRVLRESKQYSAIFGLFFSAIRWLAAVACWAVLSLILDTDKSPKAWMLYVLMALSFVATLRVYRCVWILSIITRAAAAPAEVAKVV
jgi:hypothetical protein